MSTLVSSFFSSFFSSSTAAAPTTEVQHADEEFEIIEHPHSLMPANQRDDSKDVVASTRTCRLYAKCRHPPAVPRMAAPAPAPAPSFQRSFAAVAASSNPPSQSNSPIICYATSEPVCMPALTLSPPLIAPPAPLHDLQPCLNACGEKCTCPAVEKRERSTSSSAAVIDDWALSVAEPSIKRAKRVASTPQVLLCGHEQPKHKGKSKAALRRDDKAVKRARVAKEMYEP